MIEFKQVSPTMVLVLYDGKEVGRIFSPSGSGNDQVDSIQVCGFDEAFDFWGCGVYGHNLEHRIEWVTLPPESPIYRPGYEKLMELAGKENYRREGTIWQYRKVHPQWKMKKDIQLRFMPFSPAPLIEHYMRPRKEDGWTECIRCYSEPCVCENRSPESPFKVKRARYVTLSKNPDIHV